MKQTLKIWFMTLAIVLVSDGVYAVFVGQSARELALSLWMHLTPLIMFLINSFAVYAGEMADEFPNNEKPNND